jgi:hypothetical protein
MRLPLSSSCGSPVGFSSLRGPLKSKVIKAMLFAGFKRLIGLAALATPNSFIPKLAHCLSRGRLSILDAAEFYLAARFAFAVALITYLDKSLMLVFVIAFIQITALIYLLKIVFPVKGLGLTDPSRSLFFALGHYLEIGLSMAYVYWVTNAFGPNVEMTRIQSVYFSFVTMTTIGFGDFTPKTDVGQLLVVAHSLIGVFMLATVIGLFLSLAAAGKRMRRVRRAKSR